MPGTASGKRSRCQHQGESPQEVTCFHVNHYVYALLQHTLHYNTVIKVFFCLLKDHLCKQFNIRLYISTHVAHTSAQNKYIRAYLSQKFLIINKDDDYSAL